MVHERRLISSSLSSLMIVILCGVILLSVCQVCNTQEEDDIRQNLVRDPVELGNPYHLDSGSRLNHGNVVKRKHPNHPRRPQSNVHNFPVQITSTSEEEESSSVVDEGTPRRENSRGTNKTNIPRQQNRLVDGNIANSSSHTHGSASTEESEDVACPVCVAAQQNNKVMASLDEETLRAMRVEMVKQQILKKLRLKEAPKFDNVPKGHHTVLPPIALGNPLHNKNEHGEDDDVANLDLEDFYGKTEQIIVLPQDELSECSSWENRASSNVASCFVFNLPKEVRSKQISSAELWVYKLSDLMVDESYQGENTHNFSISEIFYHYNRGKTAIRNNLITTRDSVPESAGWINFNITERARKWLVTEVHEHSIMISCNTCNKDVKKFAFDSVDEQQPFIVFNIANGKPKRRSRRSPKCSPGVTECCLESLVITFEDIKWDWIVQPKQFDAHYCKGTCHGDTALALAGTSHSKVMIDYVKNQGGVNNKTVELVPCCTATEMRSISILYRHSHSSNTTFEYVTLPNMVVVSCGCK